MPDLATLHRDAIDGGAHVLALPPWLPPMPSRTGVTGTYWHRPRSAHVHADGRVHVTLWCGPFRSFAAESLSALAFDPPADLRCGTCVGRAAGYHRQDGCVFRPRDHFAPPRWCPSTTPDPADLRRCLACGARVRCAQGWNAYGLARHRPGPDLADRVRLCPRHGWRDLAVRDDRVVCSAWRCGHDGGPDA